MSGCSVWQNQPNDDGGCCHTVFLPKQSFHFFRQMLFMSNLQGKLDDGRARNRERERVANQA